MKKFFSILFKILVALFLGILAIVVLVISINSEKVPELYGYTETRSCKAFMANYTWNAFSEILKEDSISKDYYVFKTENTLLVSPRSKAYDLK